MSAALLEAGAASAVDLVGRAPARPLHPSLAPHARHISYASSTEAERLPSPDLLILTVPDDAIVATAAAIAGWNLPPHVPALHLSGATDAGALAPLAAAGHPVGSLHPLVALSDHEAATRLRGAWFAIEGDAPATECAQRIVGAFAGRVLQVAPGGKPLYHAAAVAASNLVVALLERAEQWMTEAGADRADARAALTELAAGAVDGVARSGPVQALTGPIARGDAGTVAAHLARLSPPDRSLYSELSTAALQIAERAGLDPELAAELRRLLESTE